MVEVQADVNNLLKVRRPFFDRTADSQRPPCRLNGQILLRYRRFFLSVISVNSLRNEEEHYVGT